MTALLTSSYKPVCQLVVYAAENNAYIEHHDILEIEGKRMLAAGKPLTKKVLKKLLDQVISSDRTAIANMSKLMPTNVLYFDPRPGRLKLIWYNSAQERKMIGLRKASVTIKMPAVLYVLDDDILYIYAMRTGSKRPELKSPLYHCPLPNIYTDARICMGSVNTPKHFTEISDLIAGWEFAFWGSKFTGDLRNASFDKVLNAVIRSRKPFPVKELKPLKKTISHLIK